MITMRSFAAARTVSALVLFAFAFSACGGEEAGQSSVTAHSKAAAARAVPSASGGELAAADPGAPADTGVPADIGVPDDLVAQDFDRKIVKTAELGIRANEVRDAAAKAQQVAAGYGGSVLSSQIEGDGRVSADLVLLIPSPEFEAALDDLRGLGKKVTTDTVRGEDVTEEFVDLQSRERNLLAAEQSLLDLYDRANSVNAALAIERELTVVRGEIEQVQGRIKYLENRTASSQISLSIQPVPSPGPPTPAWSAARVVAQAWSASLTVLQALATVILSALVFGWWLIPVLAAGLLWWKRRARGPSSSEAS
jgi:Domain of unknown function (DUF4349)